MGCVLITFAAPVEDEKDYSQKLADDAEAVEVFQNQDSSQLTEDKRQKNEKLLKHSEATNALKNPPVKTRVGTLTFYFEPFQQ